MSSDIVMLANEFDKHSAKFKAKYGNIQNLYDAGWMAVAKYDGVFAAVFPGKGAVTRQNKPITSIDHIIHAPALNPGLVYFGELWAYGFPFPKISGLARQHAPAPELTFQMFDAVESHDFWSERSDIPYYRRRQWLADTDHGEWIQQASGVWAPGTSILDTARDVVSMGGYDGLILRDPNGIWKVGRSKDGEIVKVKPNISLTLRVVWARAETRDTKFGGQLGVTYRGVDSAVGSGLTQDMLIEIMNNANTYDGVLIEVEAMGLTEDGKLREPRFKGVRLDKDKADDE